MENTIKETTRLLLQGNLTKEEADKILLDLHSISQQSEMLVEFLIEFLIELNNKGLINNYDFDYEKEAKEYVLMKNKQTT